MNLCRPDANAPVTTNDGMHPVGTFFVAGGQTTRVTQPRPAASDNLHGGNDLGPPAPPLLRVVTSTFFPAVPRAACHPEHLCAAGNLLRSNRANDLMPPTPYAPGSTTFLMRATRAHPSTNWRVSFASPSRRRANPLLTPMLGMPGGTFHSRRAKTGAPTTLPLRVVIHSPLDAP